MRMSIHTHLFVYEKFTGGMWRLFHGGSGSGGFYSAGPSPSLSLSCPLSCQCKIDEEQIPARKRFPIKSCFPLFTFAMSAHELDSPLMFRWRLGFSAPTNMESSALEQEAKTVPCRSLFRLLVLEFCCELYLHGHT
jgi:hypothetical protein